jgi:predicted dehydrogenase
MALDLTAEQKEIGKANFQRVVGQCYDQRSGMTRRDLIRAAAAAGGALPITAAAYFGYESARNFRPVKAALIGSGDEGGVLVGEHNPDYLRFIAVCDVRPSNQRRIFDGEPTGPRRGLNRIYRDDAKNIKVYDDYRRMLEQEPEIEAVVIALPLHLHAPVAIDVMQYGRQQRGRPIHVLCEKLMAWNITQCKDMIRVADETDSILSIGHQRHYSLLYAHAVQVLESGILGDIRHIRALWHRNNSVPRLNSRGEPERDPQTGEIVLRDSWRPAIRPEDRDALQGRLQQLGYRSIEELVRWRLFFRTGGGLMAELGSHQLDACSIFLSKVHPLAVSGVGTRSFYRDQYRRGEREVHDHVFVSYEFPGRNHANDRDDVVVVTYSSINTNSMEGYGECVMGNQGSLIVQEERDVFLYPERGAASRSTAVTVSTSRAGAPVLDSSGTQGGPAVAAQNTGQTALGSGPPSKGYREEMEHFAWCIRQWQQGGTRTDRPQPRCHGRVAMADAIVALTANAAMESRQRIEFRPEWFDPASPEVPPHPEPRQTTT